MDRGAWRATADGELDMTGHKQQHYIEQDNLVRHRLVSTMTTSWRGSPFSILKTSNSEIE